MSAAFKWNLKKNLTIFVVDFWETELGSHPFITEGTVVNFEKNRSTFTALLYGNTLRKYSSMDFKRLFFLTHESAVEAANALPKPQTVIYQICNNKVAKKIVRGITGSYVNEVYDLRIQLSRGRDVSTSQIGRTVFLSEEDAQDYKK